LTEVGPILIFLTTLHWPPCGQLLPIITNQAPAVYSTRNAGDLTACSSIAGEDVKDKSQKQLDEERAETAREAGAAQEAEATEGQKLTAALDKARQEASEAQDKLLRLAADFDNQKKRLQREKETALKFAEEILIKELLPSIDNLERALNQDRTGENFSEQLLKGVEMTYRGLMDTLEKHGLQQLQSIGAPFDPNFHEALALEESSEVPEQSILQEYEKGYLLKNRLLRAAKVVVSKGNNRS